KLVPMGWGSIFQRRIRIFTIAIVMFTEYKVLQLRERWTKRPKMFELWKKAHERNAKRILDLIVQLEGLWVKLGQYLSTRVDVLPPAYIQLLKQLEDSLPPRPLEEAISLFWKAQINDDCFILMALQCSFTQVRKTISREFGKTVEELFLNFERIPLTTAADAQVHRATLSDGLEVVVKVQHEGIKEIILEDLKILKSVVYWVAWAEPKYDFNPIIDEWCKEAPKELDFNHEAENKRAVCKNHGWKSSFGDSNTSRVDVLIPEPIMSTKKVLILEYMDGISLTDTESLEAFGIDKQKVLKEITRAYAHQIFVDGFFSGDPKPGNFLVSKVSPHRPILLDFGLKRSLSLSEKQALAKIFLASAEGDHVGLLSSFAEMGHKPRLNIPDQMLEISTSFFLNSAAAEEAHRLVEAYAELRNKNLKVFQEKSKHNEKEVGRFDPVDAFPSDIITFSRVVHLLRGLSSTMGAPLLFIDVMTPFAESVLQWYVFPLFSVKFFLLIYRSDPCFSPFNTSWMSGTPSLSNVEEKLRKLLIELGNAGEVLGIQVCAYKDGEVIIDTVAGVLGKHDPRPVQPDSLFPLFSVSKGIAAGMVHWLVDKGVLNLEDNVGDIWPQFRCNGKDQIKVHHVLNHTSGLHNALGNALDGDAQLMMDWEECLNRIASYTPETEPGREQLYHFVSFGWLCGGIIEHGSKKQFQKVLEEAFVHPLNIDGELYIGIPPGL
ncbi:hypothetical protein M569_09728, partial [Genlisea aurea]